MEENKKQKNKDGGLATEAFFWAQALAVSLVVLIIVNIFFFRMSGVMGGSMEPTLHETDRVLLRVIGYSEPQRGDIVVVSAPQYKQGPLVKRIIAVGGDVIDIDAVTGEVYINGELQYEPYISELIRKRGDMDYPVTVPEGFVFFMGDNRNGSTDSRDSSIGMQPVSNIIGKVFFRIWPLKDFGVVR
ncbi:MAG: signal peptidase I [Clostridia bacterium]|nr:signal peptidase I [Clostridia bacterium]